MLSEKLEIKIRSEEYEKCVMVKLNPAILSKFNTEAYTIEEKAELSQRGYFICKGSYEANPIEFNENYYVLTQKVLGSYILNSSAESNRPFFLSLRGRGDFVSFLSLLHDGIGVPKNFEKDYFESHILYDPTESIFNRGLRTYPGQFVAPR